MNIKNHIRPRWIAAGIAIGVVIYALIVVSGVLMLFWSSNAAATEWDKKKHSKPQTITVNSNNRNQIDRSNNMEQTQTQGQSLEFNQSIGMGAEGGQAINDGNTITSENTSINTVLVPNNNTVDCHKVYGITFGRDDTAGGVGWPYRDVACDYEQAADDAAAMGNHELAWFWRCHKKSNQRAFGAKKFLLWQKNSPEAIKKCHSMMMASINKSAQLYEAQQRLAEVNREREIELEQYRQSQERLQQACNESKDRILEACVQK